MPSALRALAVAVAAIALLISTTVLVTATVLADQAPKLDLGTDHLAPLDQAVAREASMPTTVVAANGESLGQFMPEKRFLPIDSEHIPQLVADVVISSEDPE